MSDTKNIYGFRNNIPKTINNVANDLDIPNYKNDFVSSSYKNFSGSRNGHDHDLYYNGANGNIVGTEGVFPQMNNHKTISTRFRSRNKIGEPQFFHNNLKEEIMNESVIEYPILVDSKDRDFKIYPNPFDFRIQLEPKRIDNIRYFRPNRGILPRKIILKKTDELQAGPIFNRASTKINPNTSKTFIRKLFNLKETIGSQTITYVNIECQNDGSKNTDWTIEFILDENSEVLYSYRKNVKFDKTFYCKYFYENDLSLENTRFVILTVKEISDINRYASNSKTRKSFSIMYPTIVSKYFLNVDPDDLVKTFKNSNLGTLANLTINYCDGFGKPLKIMNLNKNVKIDECYCNQNRINYLCPCSYIRHPLYKRIQTHTSFRIGILENDISKEVFK